MHLRLIYLLFAVRTVLPFLLAFLLRVVPAASVAVPLRLTGASEVAESITIKTLRHTGRFLEQPCIALAPLHADPMVQGSICLRCAVHLDNHRGEGLPIPDH